MRIIVAECEIDYDGRASSSLSTGERVIIIKNDNSVLVHTENKLKPINYMATSDIIEFYPNVVKFDTIFATRRKPHHEVISIYIRRMINDIKLELSDSEDFTLSGSERDLQIYLMENPGMIEEGFEVLAIEFPTPAGAIDIFGQDARGIPTIVEIKRVKGSQAAAGQLKRYHDSLVEDYEGDLRAILISDGISLPALRTLERYGFTHLNLSARDIPGSWNPE
jgi:RecB family endonuclease NucS